MEFEMLKPYRAITMLNELDALPIVQYFKIVPSVQWDGKAQPNLFGSMQHPLLDVPEQSLTQQLDEMSDIEVGATVGSDLWFEQVGCNRPAAPAQLPKAQGKCPVPANGLCFYYLQLAGLDAVEFKKKTQFRWLVDLPDGG